MTTATRVGRHGQRRRLEHGRPVRHVGRREFRDETGTNVTVGISGTGGGFERFLPRRDRPFERLTADRRGRGRDLRGERRRVPRAPGRERRPDRRREPRERLGDLSDGRGAQRHLEARLEGEDLGGRPRRSRTSRSSSSAPEPTRAPSTTSPTRSTARRVRAAPTTRPRGRQRDRPGRLGHTGRPRLLRLLVLRGEPGQAEGARDRRRLGLRRAERRVGAEPVTTRRLRDRCSSTPRPRRSSGRRSRTSSGTCSRTRRRSPRRRSSSR